MQKVDSGAIRNIQQDNPCEPRREYRGGLRCYAIFVEISGKFIAYSLLPVAGEDSDSEPFSIAIVF